MKFCAFWNSELATQQRPVFAALVLAPVVMGGKRLSASQMEQRERPNLWTALASRVNVINKRQALPNYNPWPTVPYLLLRAYVNRSPMCLDNAFNPNTQHHATALRWLLSGQEEIACSDQRVFFRTQAPMRIAPILTLKSSCDRCYTSYRRLLRRHVKKIVDRPMPQGRSFGTGCASRLGWFRNEHRWHSAAWAWVRVGAYPLPPEQA